MKQDLKHRCVMNCTYYIAVQYRLKYSAILNECRLILTQWSEDGTREINALWTIQKISCFTNPAQYDVCKVINNDDVKTTSKIILTNIDITNIIKNNFFIIYEVL